MYLDKEFRGFIAGSFLAGSLINPYGMIIQGVLFVLGMIIFFDCFFSDEAVNSGTCAELLVIGVALSFVSAAYGFAAYYLLLVFFLVLCHYYKSIRKELKKTIKKK